MVSPLGAPALNKISRLVCPAGAYYTIERVNEFSGLSSIPTALLSGAYLAIAAADTHLTGSLNYKGHGRRQTSVANLVKCGLCQRPSDRTSTNVQYAPAGGDVNPLA